MNEVSIVAAFLAGIVSFLAPCVLPIIPGFLSYLGGASVSDPPTGGGIKRKDIFLNSLFFVLGFSFVFAALGVLLNTVLESVAYDAQIWLSRIGGVIIIFFGFYLMGLVRISFLEREHKFGVKAKTGSYATSFLFGLAFAAGWTPCVGPALGVILGLAATAPGLAFTLLLSYALGLGIPFLVVGLFVAEADKFIQRYSAALRYVNIAFGILLSVLGVLVFTQTLNLIANFEFLNRWLLK